MDEEAIIEETKKTYHAYIKIFMYIFAILYKSGKFRNINVSATTYKNPEVFLTVYLLHIIGKSGNILDKIYDTDIGKIWGLITEEKMLDKYIEDVASQENSTPGEIESLIKEESKRIHKALPAAIRLLYDRKDINGLHPDELDGLKQALQSISKQNMIDALKYIVNAKLKFQYSASTVIINDGIIQFINQSINLKEICETFYNSKLEIHKYKNNKTIVDRLEKSIKFFDNDDYKLLSYGNAFMFILLNIGNTQIESLKKTFDFFFEAEIYDDIFKANLAWCKE
ncbi:hypothetical protein K9M48_04350 [Candidatus Gracilibacteria bacterium]|nr:hypothetical protein [Candidatus Gracilibacteria bacterium]